MITALVLTLSAPLPAHPAVAERATPETIPLDMVVAVDESGSLSAAAVSREIEATSTIAQSVLNPNSRVTVIGFGSNNGRPGQNAVDEVCRPTVADGAVNLQYLSDCVKGLHRRTDAEGNDTDHVAALTQALATMRSGSPDRALKVIFLLTDGRLDVPRSPAYGSGSDADPLVQQRRNRAAEQQLGSLIEQTKREGAQIWPLGFGAAVTQDNLDRFAAGGSRAGCDERAASQPKARIVRDGREVTRSLLQAYAAATCSGLSPTDSTTIEPRQSRDLKIDIPVIATDGTITVSKSDPRVLAQFIDPLGRTVTAGQKVGDSSFTHSGAGTATEAMRIVNPVNGTWTVRLTAPSQVKKQLVSATALWQGAVQAAIVPEPPSARAGQEITIRLSLVTRTSAITDEAALRGLSFSVTATGAGLPQPQTIRVRDDGRAPDDKAHDGRFAGTFIAPQTPGEVSLTGMVSGTGIRAERVPIAVKVSGQETITQGQIEFDGDGTVRQGAAVQGRLIMRNGAGAPTQVLLSLQGPAGAGARLTPGSPFALPPGDSTSNFAVHFGDGTAPGGVSLTVRLADAGDPSLVYAAGLLTVTVERPPTWWDTYSRYIAGATLLLLLLALILLRVRMARIRRTNVAGIHVALTLDGERAGAELKAPHSRSREFRFAVRDSDAHAPRLAPARPDDLDRVFTVRRDGDSWVEVRTPDGERQRLAFGAESDALPTGHRLVFRDARKRRRAPARATPGDRAQETAEEPWQKTAPDYDSPWL
ncbi:vWA domain-containing protein [Nonomuraea typhae]|uniref:VWA domain-containing protein n=1 Tax=Nonomuraea typhae TaxID=2603600 RepID=A0ABW7YPS4_9ACTN